MQHLYIAYRWAHKLTLPHISTNFRLLLSFFYYNAAHANSLLTTHTQKLNCCRYTHKKIRTTTATLSALLFISHTHTSVETSMHVGYASIMCILHQQLNHPSRQISCQILSHLCSSCPALTSLSLTRGVFKQMYYSLATPAENKLSQF